MKKPAFFLAILVLAALPAAAQNNSEFGILFGGTRLENKVTNKGSNDFTFSNSAKEIYWGMQMEPQTWFRLKAGQLTVPILARDAANNRIDAGKGTIDHIDAIIDYRFSEPFGSTGIFGGVGMYRQRQSGSSDNTDAGLQIGVNADLPLSRHYGVILESAYHWMHFPENPRYITLSGGLRISF